MKKNRLRQRRTRIARIERTIRRIRLTQMIENRTRRIRMERIFLVSIDQIRKNEQKIAQGEEKRAHGDNPRSIVLRTEVGDQRNRENTRDVITTEGDTETRRRETVITFQRRNDRTDVTRRNHRLRQNN